MFPFKRRKLINFTIYVVYNGICAHFASSLHFNKEKTSMGSLVRANAHLNESIYVEKIQNPKDIPTY